MPGHALAAGGGDPRSGGVLPTAPVRAEHAELSRRITAVDALVASLTAAKTSGERRKEMADVVAFFELHLLPHAGAEESTLYALADQKAGAGDNPFTASLRHEHRVIGRWIKDLEVLLRKSAPDLADARMFARRTDALLGLVRGHFECEEETVFPLIDRTVTAEELRRVLAPGAE